MEPSPNYVELEVEEEPIVEQEEITDHQKSQPEGTSEDESRAADESSKATPIPITGLQRSTRIRQEPDRYSDHLTLISTKQQDPCSAAEAKCSPDNARWMEVMEREMRSLRQNEVWKLVDPSVGRKIIGSKWVFKHKIGENGDVERFKAWLVAQGYSHKYGLDYEEIFSPVVRFESIRSVIALGAQHRLYLHQMDVSTQWRTH